MQPKDKFRVEYLDGSSEDGQPYWQVVYQDGTQVIATGTDFGDESDAFEECQQLNWAYKLGVDDGYGLHDPAF